MAEAAGGDEALSAGSLQIGEGCVGASSDELLASVQWASEPDPACLTGVYWFVDDVRPAGTP